MFWRYTQVESMQSTKQCTSVSGSSTLHALIRPVQSCVWPNQPASNADFPHQNVQRKNTTKTLTFQTTWYQRFPWLHFSAELKAILCFHCAKADSLSLLSSCTQNEKHSLVLVSETGTRLLRSLKHTRIQLVIATMSVSYNSCMRHP